MTLTFDERRQLQAFFAIALLVLAAGIGLRAPWPADEPRFVLVAKQMWESGDWLFPHRGRELYPDKPPLYFWLLNASYALVRNWDWAFLLPSLLAALGTLWLVYDLARRLWTHQAGLLGAISVLSAFQFLYQAKRAQIDPTVVFFITLGVYGIARHTLLGPHWRWYWLGCFAAGLGVISKGVGFLALLALLPYAAMRWRKWPGLPEMAERQALRWLAGAGAFLLAISLWFVPMLVSALAGGDPEHRAYLDNLLLRQTATRYTNAWHHHQPPWYYMQVIGLFWLPFSLALPWLLPRWRDAWVARDPRVCFPLAWALLVLLFFSASPGKRDMYVLPMLPMIAVAASPYLAQISTLARFRKLLVLLCALFALALIAAGVSALFAEPRFETNLESKHGFSAHADQLWWLSFAVGAGMLLALVGLRRRALNASALALVILVVGLFSGSAAILDDSSSARGLMLRARALAGPHVTIGLVGWREQHLLQAQGPTTEFGFLRTPKQQLAEGFAWLHVDPQSRRLFVVQAALGPCVDTARAVRLGAGSRRIWYLLDLNAFKAGCEVRE